MSLIDVEAGSEVEAFPQPERQSEEHRWILDDLRAVGYRKVTDLYAFGSSFDPSDMAAAVPVLIRWLDRAHFANNQTGIVDALGGPHGRAAAPLLVERFERYRHSHVRWAVGSALAEMADRSLAPLVPQMAALAEREEFGRDRQRLVEALGRIGTPESIEAALRYVQDEDLGFWALVGIKESGKRVPEDTLIRAEAVHTDRDAAKVVAALRKRNMQAG